MATRILLFTGKGGVGKTTCAAATALIAAEMGYRTLVLSSDPAHSLADALDRKLGPEPEEVLPNLWAQEVDLFYSMKKYWGNIRELMLTVFRWQGVDRIAAEEMAALPGMNEGSVLLWLEQFYRDGTYDLIVVDSAPTGETLTLLTLPQATEWWIGKAFPLQRAAIRTAGFALRKTTGIPLDRGYEELQRLFAKLRDIQDVLGNADVSSVRLVANPERMVIEEAKRAYTYLQLYGYAVDAVIVNRVLPSEGIGDALAPYLAAQGRHLEEIDRAFEPLPVFQVAHSGREVFGIDLLREIGERIYGDRDPTALLFHGQTYRVTEQGPDYLLEVRLPFVQEGEVSARRAGDELVLQLAGQRRSYPLPKFLAYYTLGEVRVARGWLRVHFTKPAG